MSLQSLIQSAVKIANKQTASLQSSVSISQWVSEDFKGKRTYGVTPVVVSALVEQSLHPMKTISGEEILVKAVVSILQPVAPNGATGRVEPIDKRDIVTLPDGTTGPIVNVSNAMTDPSTGRGYLYQIWLGA